MTTKQTFSKLALVTAILAALPTVVQAAAPDGRYVNGTFSVTEDETLTISGNKSGVGAVSTDTSVTITEGASLTVQGTVNGSDPQRLYAYGINSNPNLSLNIDGTLSVDISTTGTAKNALAIYVLGNNATFTGDIYTIYENFPDNIKAKIDVTSFTNRWKAIDPIFQCGIKSKIETPIRSRSWNVDLQDPETVKDINNKFFIKNPIDLNRI